MRGERGGVEELGLGCGRDNRKRKRPEAGSQCSFIRKMPESGDGRTIRPSESQGEAVKTDLSSARTARDEQDVGPKRSPMAQRATSLTCTDRCSQGAEFVGYFHNESNSQSRKWCDTNHSAAFQLLPVATVKWLRLH